MQHLQSIIVDDEESARDVLENLLIRFCPEVSVVDKCTGIPQAVESIKKHQPKVVFLDIEMPNYAGFEIVNFFPDPDFKIIFVTAYDQYAIRAFEVAAIDYLLKPVDIERLKKAVARAQKETTSQNLLLLSQTLEIREVKHITISEKNEQHIVAVAEIIAIEADGSYCTVHTVKRKYVVSKPLKHFEDLLDMLPNVVRSHKSWLINKNHLVSYSKTDFSITLKGNLIAKLSKYKKDVLE